MNEEILCACCGKEIQKQKVLMCANCKIAVRVEYQAIKRQALEQREEEEIQFHMYDVKGGVLVD